MLEEFAMDQSRTFGPSLAPQRAAYIRKVPQTFMIFECVNVSNKAVDIQLKLAKVKSAYTQAMKEHYGLEEAHLARR